MFCCKFNRLHQLWREAFLAVEVIYLSFGANTLILGSCLTKSPRPLHVWKFQQTSTRLDSSSCPKLHFLSRSTLARGLYSPFCKRSTGPLDMNINEGMSGKSYSSANYVSNLMSSLPENLSVHTANITEVHNVPMRVLIRPFPSVLDEKKVKSLMATIQDPDTEDQVPPIDIMWVEGREGGNYYYSFGGCHRYEAYKRLNRETIPCKLFKSSVENLRPYLGASTPDLL